MAQRFTKRSLVFVVVGLLVAGGLFLFRPRLQHRVMLGAALQEPSVSVEFLEELAVNDPHPLAVIETFYRTGKIPHRLAALRALSRGSWLEQLNPAPDWLREAGLEADFQVRELTLGMIRYLDRPTAALLVNAGLRDVDPELKHVAVRAAVAAGLTNLINDVVGLLDDQSLNVRIAATAALRQWTGQDFGVRRALLGGEYNDLSGDQSQIDPEALAQVESGISKWKTWWTANSADWAKPAPEATIKLSEPASRLAPDFALSTLDGNTVRLSELRGRPVLINFWATWCTACWSELPELVKLHERHQDDLVVVGIALDGLPDQHELDHGHKEGDPDHEGEHPGQADAHTPHDELVALVGGFAKQKGLNYTILLDPEGQTSMVYQGNELPMNVLINKQGQLVRRFLGPRSPGAFDAMIAEVK